MANRRRQGSKVRHAGRAIWRSSDIIMRSPPDFWIWGLDDGPPEGSWLARMLERKPRMVVRLALTNKIAHGLWAMAVKKEDYKVPKVVAA